MWALRQSTASQEIPLGPFVDTAGAAVTGLTIANTDVKLQKTGGTTQINKNSGGATHIATGDYYCVLDATDTDTIGPLRVKVHVAGALPVWLDCVVYDEAVYDVLFGTTAPATVTNITGGTITTVTTVTTCTTLTNLPAITAGWLTATGIAADAITAAKIADGAIDTATFAAGTTIPRVTLADTLTTYTGNTVQTGDSFARIGAAGVGLTNVVLPSGGLANVTAWTVAITGNVTGNLSGSVGSVTGAVGSVTGAVGSVTVVVSANVTKVNGITIDGTGTTLDPWGPV